MDTKGMDLNLLVTLEALLVEQNVTKAANRLNADGSHYGLIWQGNAPLDGAQLEFANWLQGECSRSFG